MREHIIAVWLKESIDNPMFIGINAEHDLTVTNMRGDACPFDGYSAACEAMSDLTDDEDFLDLMGACDFTLEIEQK